jgi:hypothetical protein
VNRKERASFESSRKKGGFQNIHAKSGFKSLGNILFCFHAENSAIDINFAKKKKKVLPHRSGSNVPGSNVV